MQQTYRQRSSMAAENKHRELAFLFFRANLLYVLNMKMQSDAEESQI